MRTRLLSVTGAALTVAFFTSFATQAQAASYYTCVKNLYVDATLGHDGKPNDGSALLPFKTIGYSSWNLQPGTCLNVQNGVYVEQPTIANTGVGSSTPSGYAVVRAVNHGQAKIRAPQTGGAGTTVSIITSYVILDGFEVDGQITKGGPTGHCVGAAVRKYNSKGGYTGSTHIQIINNSIHDCGGSGIGLAYGDLYQVSHNVVYNTSCCNPLQGSGITIYEPQYNPSDTNGDDVKQPYRISVTYNSTFNNFETNAVAPYGQHTDGNGIAFDTFNNSQTGGINYTPTSLIAYNLSFMNGGKGIVATWSNNVVIDHNTAYDNNLDTGNPATWRGEIDMQFGNNVTMSNNIAYAAPMKGDARVYDSAYSAEPASNQNFAFTNNLSFNGTTGNASISKTMKSYSWLPAANKYLGVDPQFISLAPNALNFGLQKTSPVYSKSVGYW